MSQIANFYVVPDSAIAEVQNAAAPRKLKWYRAREDLFWQTLRASAGHDRLNPGMGTKAGSDTVNR
jgi:hypothetical protein